MSIAGENGRANGALPPRAHDAETARHWEEIAGDWGESHPHLLWRRYCDQAHSALLERWLPPEQMARVLKTDLFDEVVSEGLYPVLAQRADSVVGMDIAVAAAAQARHRHAGLTAVACDARRLPFGDASFDAVVSNSTLDHFVTLDEVAIALGELARITRPGGTLIVTLDNRANPAVWLRSVLPFTLLNRLGIVPYFVGATCGPARLRALVAAAGFTVERVEMVMHCPRVLAVALARLIDRFGSARTRERYLRHLAGYERLARWPTRERSGYFTAVRAVRIAPAAVTVRRTSRPVELRASLLTVAADVAREGA